MSAANLQMPQSTHFPPLKSLPFLLIRCFLLRLPQQIPPAGQPYRRRFPNPSSVQHIPRVLPYIILLSEPLLSQNFPFSILFHPFSFL
jgi:hypothetical protein